jgi:hypothetical protein
MRFTPVIGVGLVVSAAFAANGFSVTEHNQVTVTKLGSGTGTVTSNAPGMTPQPINCGSSCSGLFKGPVTVTLSAAPSGGSSFGGWGGACGGTGSCSIFIPNPPENGLTFAVTATFVGPVKHMLSVATAGVGKGTVSSSPEGIACPGACGNGFVVGTTVTLTATPDAVSLFSGWSGACTGSQPTCQLTMSQDQSVTATFDQKPFALTVAKAGTGAGTVTSVPAGIDCGATCAAQLAGSVQLTATPAPGSAFVGWSGACSGAAACSLTMDGDKSVSAEFADTAAPVVHALASSGRRGKDAKLRYSVSDASGQTAERVTVVRRGKTLGVVSRRLGVVKSVEVVVWHVPRKLAPGMARFCVVASDPAHNKSAPSCANLRIT